MSRGSFGCVEEAASWVSLLPKLVPLPTAEHLEDSEK